jgi:CPA2 family monovalent cation:H+ antiporter-2
VEHALLTDILLLLAASIPIVVLLRKVRLPSLAGFLLVGVLLGPHALGWIQAREEVESLAEIGVALLLFTIGLEFSIPRLLLLRRALFLGGGGQVLTTIAVVTASAWALGVEPRTAVLFAFLAATSSTAVVLKTYSDEGQIETPHGQFSVAVLLFQDLAVIPLLLLLPVVSGESGGGVLAFAVAIGKAILGVGTVLLVARFGFSRLATVVVRSGGRELFTLFIVLAALGAAWVTQTLGLPLALGAFVAGLVISESEYSHQVVDEILPFRDVFNALFFVSVGMLLDASILVREPLVVLGLCLAVSFIKGGIVFGLAWWLRGSRRVAFLAAATLFQVGEFSFVLAQQAGALGVLEGDYEQRFLAVAVLTMLVTPFVIQGAHHWVERASAAGGGATRPGDGGAERTQVLVAGYGMTGKNLSRVLQATAIQHRILEMDPDLVRVAKAGGAQIVLGDASRSDALSQAGIEHVRVFVVAINDPAATRRAVTLARRQAPGVQIIVRTRFLTDTEDLLRLGANQVVPEDFETSLEIFARVLRDLHVPQGMIAVQTEIIRREGYQLLRGPVAEARHLEVLGEVLANMAVDTIFVGSTSSSCGRSLGELAFRARSGATVLSAVRAENEIQGPGADFVLEPGDLLVVRGNHDQLDRARDLIAGSVDPDRAERRP